MELTFNIFLKCFQVLKAKPTLKKKKKCRAIKRAEKQGYIQGQ